MNMNPKHYKEGGRKAIYNNILVEDEGVVQVVTVNRPNVLNALNEETLLELYEAVTLAKKDDSRVLVLTGAGERAFVAGADIKQMRDLSALEGRRMTILGQTVMWELEELEKPVIAAVNGYALGGGCELAMACDIRIASTKAVFGQPEVNLGIIPGFGGTQRLARLVGSGRAKYYCMTGEQIQAQEAFRLGLCEKLVEPERLMEETMRIARLIAEKGPVAVRMVKRAICNGLNADLKTGVAYEAEAYTTAFATQDRVEGMSAFLEKRKPKFQSK